MRGFIIGVATTVVIGLICAYIVLQSGLLPANADAKPGGLELWAASASLNATLRASAPKGPNPVALTDENLIEGVKLYGHHCALCHGTADGDASASPVSKGLYPKPPQLATDGVEDDPEGYSYWRIKHGVRLTGMPSWAGALTDQQIWSIALFLKHMDKLPPGPQAAWKQVSN
jgi:thiosulfate dehydrogenase